MVNLTYFSPLTIKGATPAGEFRFRGLHFRHLKENSDMATVPKQVYG